MNNVCVVRVCLKLRLFYYFILYKNKKNMMK